MIDRMIAALDNDHTLRRATYFSAERYTIKVSRRFRPDKRNRQEIFVVTRGVPNYAEQHFIKLCRKAGEPFPVKKLQLTRFPKRRG